MSTDEQKEELSDLSVDAETAEEVKGGSGLGRFGGNRNRFSTDNDPKGGGAKIAIA